jgi:hypothetical protein
VQIGKPLKLTNHFSELIESLKAIDIVLDSTEPANYTGSYTTVRKRVVDTEIAMQQTSRRILTTATQRLSLLKLTVSED